MTSKSEIKQDSRHNRTSSLSNHLNTDQCNKRYPLQHTVWGLGSLLPFYLENFNTFDGYCDYYVNQILSKQLNTNQTNSTNFRMDLDIQDSNDNYVVKVDIPGVDKKDIQLNLHENMLTISAKRNSETSKDDSYFQYTERSFGDVSRTLNLPDTVDTQSPVSAKYQDGVLTVGFSKKPKQQSTQIMIE